MALRSSTGVCCNWGCGNSFVGWIVVATLLSSRAWKYIISPKTSANERVVTIISAMANLPTAHTLMSVVSWRSRGLRGCLVSSMFQNLLEVRGVPGHQRTLLQLGEKVG